MYGRTPGNLPNGVQPASRPDGSVIVSYEVFTLNPGGNHIGAVRSVDGGQTWGPAARVASIEESQVTGMRAGPLPSMDVDARGNVYIAWSDCHFSDLCANDVAVPVAGRRQLVCSDPGPIDTIEAGCTASSPGGRRSAMDGAPSVPHDEDGRAVTERTCTESTSASSLRRRHDLNRTQRLTRHALSGSSRPASPHAGEYISTSGSQAARTGLLPRFSDCKGQFRQPVSPPRASANASSAGDLDPRARDDARQSSAGCTAARGRNR